MAFDYSDHSVDETKKKGKLDRFTQLQRVCLECRQFGEGDRDSGRGDKPAKEACKHYTASVSQYPYSDIADIGDRGDDHCHEPGFVGIDQSIGSHHPVRQYRQYKEGHRKQEQGSAYLGRVYLRFDALEIGFDLEDDRDRNSDKDRFLLHPDFDHRPQYKGDQCRHLRGHTVFVKLKYLEKIGEQYQHYQNLQGFVKRMRQTHSSNAWYVASR